MIKSAAAWIPLVIAMALNAAANLLLKIGAVSEDALVGDGSRTARALAFMNGLTIAAMVLFGLNLLFYRKALHDLPLAIAYPVMLSGSLVLVTLGAWGIPRLAEPISPIQLGGMAVIAVGVWMVTRT